MICVHCTENVEPADVCPSCGESPLLDGGYRLDEKVGRGGTGTTYRATRLEDDTGVAVKKLPVGRVEDVKTLEMFEREASVLEQLDHPGVPSYHDDLTAGQGAGLALYLVQEFVEGTTLAERVQRHRPSEDDVLGVMVEVLEIFRYLHGRAPPVIHRDVKPENIMVRASDGGLVLVDFGSVRAVIEDREQGGSTVTGTFGYMAPEQFMGKAEPATDVYGLGATAVALLAGTEPRELMGHDRRLHWQSAVDVQPAVAGLLEDMLRPDPADRPTDADELIARIRRIRKGEASVEKREASVEQSSASTEEPSDGTLVDRSPPRELSNDSFQRRISPIRIKQTPLVLFGGLGLGSTIISLFWLAAQPDWSGAVLLTFGALLATFAGVRLQKVWNRMSELQDVFRDGHRTRAEITEVVQSGGLLSQPMKFSYKFTIDSGTYEGQTELYKVDSIDLNPDGGATVLYDSEAPSRNTLVFEEKGLV